jgi:anti-sigma B factor antagonist
MLNGTYADGTLHLVANTARLDAASAPGFKREFEAAWRAGVQRVTVDLGAVEFLDSSGVGALLSIYKRLPKENPSVRLLRVKATVQSVIELLRLHRIFEVQS